MTTLAHEDREPTAPRKLRSAGAERAWQACQDRAAPIAYKLALEDGLSDINVRLILFRLGEDSFWAPRPTGNTWPTTRIVAMRLAVTVHESAVKRATGRRLPAVENHCRWCLTTFRHFWADAEFVAMKEHASKCGADWDIYPMWIPSERQIAEAGEFLSMAGATS